MKTIEVQKVATFTHEYAGGNPAGVVLQAENLNRELRQSVAREAGYSETAFIDTLENGELKFEFFTPKRQIDICGHATVGAFSLLRDKGLIEIGPQSFSSVLGKHKVEVQQNYVGLWQQAQFSKLLDSEIWLDSIADSLNLNVAQIVSPIRHASTGSAFALIEVSTSSQLASIVPKQDEILAISNRLDLVGYYLYSKAGDGIFDARMFAPRYGINEESATGMGAGALSTALSPKDEAVELIVRQGHLMPIPSPSILNASLGSDGRVIVSGQSKLNEVKRISIP